MLFYKVVTKNFDRLVSAGFYDLPMNFRTFYVPNQWTYPPVKDTRLFVFNDRIAAKLFARWGSRYRRPDRPGAWVYECDVLHPKPAPIVADLGHVIDFWKIKLGGRCWDEVSAHRQLMYTFTTYAPSGTYIAEAVKLLEIC